MAKWARAACVGMGHRDHDPLIDVALQKDDVAVFVLTTRYSKGRYDDLAIEKLDDLAQLAIAHDAPLCFQAALERMRPKPGFLKAFRPSSTQGDTTALLFAVRHGNPRFTMLLLDYGADPTQEYFQASSQQRWTAIARALTAGRVENADALYLRYRKEQRESMWNADRQGTELWGRILAQWLIKRHASLLDALQWLKSK
ncbi:hypothetical protein LTR95_016170 [Oleoguttula sp. CCFEE 5521]